MRKLIKAIYNAKSRDVFSKHISWKLNAEQFILLSTLPRSGTHYLRCVLGNYLLLLAGNEEKFIDDIGEIFPLNFDFDIYNTKEPIGKTNNKYLSLKKNQYLSATNIYDIVRCHALPSILFKHFSVIHLYRDPIPFFESYFTYMYGKRMEKSSIPDNINLINKHVGYYIGMINSYRNSADPLVAINYKYLIGSSREAISYVLKFIFGHGYRINSDFLETSIIISSKENTLLRENANHIVNKDARSLRGSFIDTGEWKVSLSESDRLYLLGILAKHDIPEMLEDHFVIV
ncbi:hypothetical protein N9K35_04490 [Pseudomonadales bacterium]|nr:hypothetical protein [Pseudomonadales bacterium]